VIFDAGKVDTENLAVRPWKAGDRLAPFGMEGTKKVSDVFIDEKIPKADRLQWPVIVYGDEVFWVVGLRASRIAVVDAKTRRYGVLVAEWDRD
jgi:tRNA(Ile)-lysidine synthase